MGCIYFGQRADQHEIVESLYQLECETQLVAFLRAMIIITILWYFIIVTRKLVLNSCQTGDCINIRIGK